MRNMLLIGLFMPCSFGPMDVLAEEITSHGHCSPNIIGNSGKVTITCTNVDPGSVAQVEKAVRILNEILKGQQRSQEILAKFDEIIKSLNQRTGALETRAVDRTISVQQRRVFVGILRKHPNGQASIGAVANDREAIGFARQLQEAMREAGWSVGAVDALHSTAPPTGLVLVYGEDPATPVANVLYKALRSIGFDAAGQLHRELGRDKVTIQVGFKPRTSR